MLPPGEIGLGSNGNEWVHHTLQISRTGAYTQDTYRGGYGGILTLHPLQEAQLSYCKIHRQEEYHLWENLFQSQIFCNNQPHSFSCRKFSSSFTSRILNLRSEQTMIRKLSTFASILCVFGYPLLAST